MSVRRSLLALVPVAFLLGLPACSLNIGSHGVDFETDSKRDDTVELVERRRFSAMIAQDLEALEPMLAEELNYGHSNGEVETKPQFLETIRTGRIRYEALDVKKLDVRLYDDIALVTGSVACKAQVGGQPLAIDLRYTDAYVRRDGRWQLIAWQSTRVP